MIPLDNDHAVLDRPTGGALVFHLGGDLLQAGVVQIEAVNRRDSLPLAPFCLALDADDAVTGALRTGSRLSLFADARGFGPSAFGTATSGFGGLDEAGVGHRFLTP